MFNMDNADTVFSVVTILTGIFGTIITSACWPSRSRPPRLIVCFAIGELFMFSQLIWRAIMCIVTIVLLLVSVAWGIGWRVSRTHLAPNGSQDASTEHASGQQHEPLLGSEG
eukprot:jgi/Chlat1/3676/Chrsp24S03850